MDLKKNHIDAEPDGRSQALRYARPAQDRFDGLVATITDHELSLVRDLGIPTGDERA